MCIKYTEEKNNHELAVKKMADIAALNDTSKIEYSKIIKALECKVATTSEENKRLKEEVRYQQEALVKIKARHTCNIL